jgi:pyruvate kinase
LPKARSCWSRAQPFVLDAARTEPGDMHGVGLDYKELPRDVKAGDVLLLNDGLIVLTVDAVRGEQVHTTVKLGGELSNNKGINKQGGGLTAPALTAKDMEDIRTAMSFQADYVAVSFPKNATDMEMARQLCNVAAAEYRHKPGLIAKIERAEAIPTWNPSCWPATASWWRAVTWRWKWATRPCRRCKNA